MKKTSDKRQEKKAQKARKTKKIFIFALYALLFVVMAALSFGGLALSVYSDQIANALHSTRFRYQVGDNAPVYVNLDELYSDGMLYLSMNDIAELCELTVTGDHTKRTYFPTDDSENYVTFYFSSNQVIVNGEKMLMKAETYTVDKTIYVPVSFFENYMTGIEITVDEEKNRISVKRVSLGTKYNVLDELVEDYQEISFIAGSGTNIESINESVIIAAFPEPTDDTQDADGDEPNSQPLQQEPKNQLGNNQTNNSPPLTNLID